MFCVAGKVIGKIVRNRRIIVFLRFIIPFKIFLHAGIPAAGNDRSISDIIHIANNIIRAGDKINECLRCLLLRGIAADPALQHDPSVKIDVGRFLRHCIIQKISVFLCLIHGISGIAGPLVICDNLSRDHIRFSGVCLKRVNIIFYVLQIVLYLRNFIRGCVVHQVFKIHMISGIAAKFI